jgi:hypothetical protein
MVRNLIQFQLKRRLSSLKASLERCVCIPFTIILITYAYLVIQN